MLLDLPLNFYKLGSIVEMIIFTYGIMYQAKKMNEENGVMRQKLVKYTQQLRIKDRGIVENDVTVQELIETFGLTKKEIEILKDVAKGKINKEIAAEQFISVNTVKFHIRNIFNKLDVNTRGEATIKYINFDMN